MLMLIGTEHRVVRPPVVTVLVMVLCVIIYWQQCRSTGQVAAAITSSCRGLDASERMALAEFYQGERDCPAVMAALAAAPDPSAAIREVVHRVRLTSATEGWADYVEQTAEARLQRFRNRVPDGELTARLMYHPETWSLWRAITSSVAHGSFMHLAGNLFFFFAFSWTVEAFLGPFRYLGALLVLAIGTSYAYSFVNLGDAAPPTLGLSGVVYGVITLFTWALPNGKLRMFYWFFVRFGVLTIPAWVFALWYVGGDTWSLLHHSGGHINLVAHISGAIIGVLLAATVFGAQTRAVRHEEITAGALHA
jgi:membrane associated rhomboid family serine protease